MSPELSLLFLDKLLLNATSAYSGRLPDCEIEAREIVQKALENSDEDIRGLLGKLMMEFCGQVRSSTGIQDADNILCTSLVDFFREYAAEFRIDVAPVGVIKRTLRCALQELDSFLSGAHYNGTYPMWCNRTNHTIVASIYSVVAVLQAVRKFLIEKASEDIDRDQAPAASLLQHATSSLPNIDTDPPNDKTVAISTEAKASSVLNKAQDANPDDKNGRRVKIGMASQERDEKTSIEMKNQAEPLLKRKRSGSNVETSFLQNIVQNAKKMEAFCREQENDIAGLKATRTRTEKLVQELAASQAKVKDLEETARLQRCSLEGLEIAKLEVQEAQNRAATATDDLNKVQRKAENRKKERDDLKLEQLDASIEVDHHKKVARQAVKKREQAQKEMQKTVDLKNAMRDMLMVTGAGFTADAIEAAAEAITEGEHPRSVIADMIRKGMS